MPEISEKGRLMPASPIRKLVPYAEKARSLGRTVYQLNIGQPDIPTPESALEALRTMDKKVLEYSHSAGYQSYREKLAKYYSKIGIPVNADQILITTGGSEAILFGMMACMDAGSEIIVPEPFYANYLGFAIAAGLQVVPVTANIQNGFALPPVEAIEAKITPKTRAIFICNPNNPTGYLYAENELKSLAALVKKHDLYLFSDEVYREFCYDSTAHISALSLKGIEENVIMVDSVSKRYSACGIRIGALVTRNKDVTETVLKFAQARLSPPGLGQIAAEAALETPPEYFKEVYEEYILRRNFMVNRLNKMEGVTCPKPRGAFYTMVELPVEDTDDFSQWLLDEFEYQNQTVMLAPASGFYATPGLGKKEVRIAYVLNQEDLAKALDCLEAGLKSYPGIKTK